MVHVYFGVMFIKKITFLYLYTVYFEIVFSGDTSQSTLCSFNKTDNRKLTLSSLPQWRLPLRLTADYSNSKVFPNSTVVWRIQYKNGDTEVLGQCVREVCSSNERFDIQNNYTSKVSNLLIKSVTMAEDENTIEFVVDNEKIGNETLTVYVFPNFQEANIKNRATSDVYEINDTYPFEIDLKVGCMNPLPRILVKFKETNSEIFVQLYPHTREILDCRECGKNQRKLTAHLIAIRSIFTKKTLMHGILNIFLRYGCYEDLISSLNVTVAKVEDEEKTLCYIPEGIVFRILLFTFSTFLNLRYLCPIKPFERRWLNPFRSKKGAMTTTEYIQGVIRYETDDGNFSPGAVISVTVFVSLLAYITGLAVVLLLPKWGVPDTHLEEHCAYTSLVQLLWSPGIVIGLSTSICTNTIHKLLLWIYAMNRRSTPGNQGGRPTNGSQIAIRSEDTSLIS